MTLTQKITRLTWWNEISKLKNILFELKDNSGTKLTKGQVDALNSSNNPTTTNPFMTLNAVYDIIYAVGDHIPTYANNSAAIAGGLAVNRLYKTPTGDPKIVI